MDQNKAKQGKQKENKAKNKTGLKVKANIYL
jgi:hypothetical protein